MRTTKRKLLMPWVSALASLTFLLAAGAARAQQAVTPGRSVGRVFLGMQHDDVWKILRRPTRSRVLPSSRLPAPHPPGRYTADEWETSDHSLTILYRDAKAVQIEVNSQQFTAPGGVSVATPFTVLRQRFPGMRVDQYLFAGTAEDEVGGAGALVLYADDVHRGIAFTSGTEDDAADEEAYDALLQSNPDELIVHLPGQRVLPVDAYWRTRISVAPRTQDDYLSEIRTWFAGGPHPKITKEDH